MSRTGRAAEHKGEDMNETKRTDNSRWLEFDRSDRIGLVVTLFAIAIAAVGMLVVAPLIAWARGETLPVPFLSEVQIPALDSAGVDHSEAAYMLLLEDASTGQRLLALAPDLAMAVLVLCCVALVLWIVRTIGAGDPFAPGQVGRLRGVAALLAFGVPVIEFARLPFMGGVLSGVDLGGLDPGVTITIPWLPIVVGLCVALLAEAFRAGARLRDDVEGLI
mgnify:CR=1 FL=1